MTKTYDNIRAGTKFLLQIDDRDRLPFEMKWAEKWITIRVISDDKILVRSLELKRDIVLMRFATVLWKGRVGRSLGMIFSPTIERLLIMPTKLIYQKKHTSIVIDEAPALEFLIAHTGNTFHDTVNDVIYRLTQDKVDSMAHEVLEAYKEKTGRTPSYLPVFNSIISSDLLFLKELKKSYKGEVNMNQMRWMAFKADDLNYNS